MQDAHHELGLKLIIVLCCVLLLGWLYYQSLQAPINQNNLCLLFKDKPSWYWQVTDSEKKWHIPVSVQMAVMQRESHFRAAIQPPHQRLLGVLPWQHVSSAQGYTQALDGTWRSYLHITHQRSASRSDFAKAVDFIGWYMSHLRHVTGIASNDTFRLYLAYHEGAAGYLARRYLSKPWLLAVAQDVSRHAERYHQQLVRCHSTLSPRPWWHFWS